MISESLITAQAVNKEDEMNIGMRMELRRRPRNMTESVFPRAKALLDSNRSLRNAVNFLVTKKTGDQYKDIVDCLFCELFPNWQDPCRRYYDNKEPPLREVLQTWEAEVYDDLLVVALKVALDLHVEGCPVTWTQYRTAVGMEAYLRSQLC